MSSHVRGLVGAHQNHVLPCPAVFRDVQQRSGTSSARENCETNPSLPRLTGRQLAAARMTAQGVGSADVAKEIRTTQRTVDRWRLTIGFQVEVRRVHELMVLEAAKRGIDRPDAQRLFCGAAAQAEPGESHLRAARPAAEALEDDLGDVEAWIHAIFSQEQMQEPSGQ